MATKFFKLLVFSLVVLFLGSSQVLANELPFRDVLQNHPNFKAIQYLKEIGAINGTPEGDFQPDEKITRAAALKIIVRALSHYFPEDDKGQAAALEPDDLKFTDLTVPEWYVPYVRYALTGKIISGYKDGTFQPANPIIRAEGLKIIINIFDLKGSGSFMANDFTDVSENDWYNKYFGYAQKKNILLPEETGKGYPAKELTRGELSELIYRVLLMKNNNWSSYKLWADWPEEDIHFVRSKIHLPTGWQIEKNEAEVIIWRRDEQLQQTSSRLIYPKSASLQLFLDNPELEMSSYFRNLKSTFVDWKQISEVDNILQVSNEEKIYTFKFLDKNTVIVMFGQTGNSTAMASNKQFLQDIIESHSVIAGESPEEKKADIISSLNSIINVEKEGLKTINSIEDKQIIATDTIGVGTGPVDYYYLNIIDYTIKYERSFDVILAIRQGKTDKF